MRAALVLAVSVLLALPAGSATAAWERTWGRDVVSGAPHPFEVCTIAANCKAGIADGLGGEIGGAQGVATDAAGNVYVAEGNRISKFNGDGTFERAWGRDAVVGGGSGFEVCTVATECRQGPGGGLGGELSSPSEIAVGPTGLVYVVDGNRIQRFTGAGVWERAWGRDVVSVGVGSGAEICTNPVQCKLALTGDEGGHLNGPTGIAVDAAGDVYVTEIPNNRVQRFDADGNFERAWGRDVDQSQIGGSFEVCTTAADCQMGTTGGLGGEMNEPRGIAVEAAGDVFVADQANQRIQRFSADGAFEAAWGKAVDGVEAGSGFEVCDVALDCLAGAVGALGGEMNRPRGVAVDASSNVYVAEEELGRVQRFSTAGTWERAWGEDVVEPPDTGFEICTPATAACKATPGGQTAGAMLFPADLALDSSGNVFLGDAGNSRVQKYSSDGIWDRAWGRGVIAGGGTDAEVCTTLTPAPCQASVLGHGGEFNGVVGLATDPAGNVVVVDSGYNRLQKFAGSGAFLRSWGRDALVAPGNEFEICTVATACKAPPPGSLAGEVNGPVDVATDAAGRIYLTDSGNHRVQRYDANGNFERTWGKDVVDGGGSGFEVCTVPADCQAGTPGADGGELTLPIGIAIGPTGDVFVADGQRVQRFSADGAWERAWGKDVLDSGGDGFEVCTAAAACKSGVAGSLGGEFFGLWDMAVDGAGNVYATERVNLRVQKFDSDGVWQRAWGRDVDDAIGDGFEVCTAAGECQQGESGGLGGELSSPAGIATDFSGDVFVADVPSHRIQRFSSDGAFEAAWGKAVDDVEPGSGFEVCEVAADCLAGTAGGLGGEMTLPLSVGIDPAGTVYVSEQASHRVQRFVEFATPTPPPVVPPDDDGPIDGGGPGPGPGPEAPGPGLPVGPVVDVIAPVVRSVRIDARFAARARPAPLAVVAQRRRRGATITVSVDEAANLALLVQRERRGFRRGRRCVARPPSRARCTRRTGAGTLRVAVPAGVTRLRFSGWLGARRLRPGRYRLLVTATDAAGNRSVAKASNRFRLIR